LTGKHLNQRFVISGIAGVAIAAIILLLNVVAAQAVDNDGRINLVYHLGGDVIYCVDANWTPADSYAEGGLQLLNESGQKLFFVPAADIDAVPELPDANMVIVEGSGSYGTVTLWRLSNGNFALTGVDEHGNAYQFEWTGCIQVGEVGSAPSDKTPEPVILPTPTFLPS